MDKKPSTPWRSRNVWALSLASLLNDVASEMVMPLLPVFLSGLTSHGAAVLGLIEGLADLVASGLKWWVGRVSDRSGKTRPFVLSGYSLAALVRPMMSIAASPVHVLLIRLTDRVGKGLRTAPRDAMLAASVPPEQRGAAFGFHRSMDHAGAAIGPMVALAVLTFWTTDLRVIFSLTLLPGLLTVLLAAASQETAFPRAPSEGPPVAHEGAEGMWRILVPIGLATLGTASDSFLMLKAGVDDAAPLVALPMLWVALHLVRTSAATPGGWLADRTSARGIVTVGWSIRAAVFLILAFAPTLWWTALAVALYGLASMSDGAEKKLVTWFAPPNAQGTAFGTFHAVVGICALPASLGFGLLWQSFGSAIAFGVSSLLIAVAILSLWLLAAPPASREVVADGAH